MYISNPLSHLMSINSCCVILVERNLSLKKFFKEKELQVVERVLYIKKTFLDVPD